MENKNYTLPENSGKIIGEILSKYGFEKKQRDDIKKLTESIDPKIREVILESLPGVKISQIVKDCAERKINMDDLPSALKAGLEISEKKARQIAEELIEKIFELPIRTAETEKIRPAKKDSYREPVE